MKSRLLLLLPFLFFIASCDDTSNTDPSKQAPTVDAVKIVPKDVPLSFEFPARAKGSKEIEVRARVGGILLARSYTEGSEVKEGDILFQIDPEPYKAELLSAKGNLADVTAQLKAAVSQWNRISKLFEDRIVSEKSRDEARAHMDALKASVSSAEGAVQNAQLNLDYTTVTAPITGMTSLESQSEGSLIVANSDASLLTTISQLDPIYIMFSVSDTDIFKMRSMVDENLVDNPKAGGTFAKVKFSDGTEYEEKGSINFINPTIDETTGTVMLRAVFPNHKHKIMPKQFVRLVLDGLVMRDAIAIPSEAVLQGAQGSFVYRINSQGIVEVALVQTGFTSKDGQWVIESGLNPGDVVVINGVMKVRQGLPATPNFEDASKPATASASTAPEAVNE